MLGATAVLLGIGLAVVRFYYGIKPHLFDLTVPAIFTSYLEPRYFTMTTNHYSEEIAGALILVGLFALAFSEEKVEDDLVAFARSRALILTFYLNTAFLLGSLLWLFGVGFIDAMVVNLFSPLCIYLLCFRQQLTRARRRAGYRGPQVEAV